MAYTHPEDVKGAIRKRYGSVAAFERAKELPQLSVRDVLRGKRRSRIAGVIAHELGVPVADLEVLGTSHNRDNSDIRRPAHRLSGAAK